mgnify:CR=1 FL=1
MKFYFLLSQMHTLMPALICELSKSRDSVCANICISGTASSRSWYFQFQTHDRGRDWTERILQAEEQISTRRFAAEVGVSQLVVHRTLKEQGHMFKKCNV